MCRVLKPEHAVRVLTDDAAYAAVIDRRFRALGLTLLDQAEVRRLLAASACLIRSLRPLPTPSPDAV